MPLPTLDFLYDWKGRRIAKIVTLGTSSAFTGFAYDGWNIVAALEQSTPLAVDMKIVRSVWGLDRSGGFQGAGGVGGLLATRTAESIYNSGSYSYPAPTESKRHFPSFDGNGNIIAWTDDASATTTTRDFDAFGNVVTNQGTRWSASTPYGFSTKYEDVETGLLYYGYRYYDPVTGRWPSRDPIGENGGINLYGMVGNNLIDDIDYLGMFDFPLPTNFNYPNGHGMDPRPVAAIPAEIAGFFGIEGMMHGLPTHLVREYIARGNGFTLDDEEFAQAVWGGVAKRMHPIEKAMDPGTHSGQIMTMQQDSKGQFIKDANRKIGQGGGDFLGGKYQITTYATQNATYGNFSMWIKGKFCVDSHGDYTGWAALKASDKFDFNKSTHRSHAAEQTTANGRRWLGDHSFWTQTKVYKVYVEENIHNMYDGFIELKTEGVLGLYEEKGDGLEGTGEGR